MHTIDEQRREVALVTGASSGIGWLVAERLVASGLRVFGTSRSNRPGPDGVEMLALNVDDDVSVNTCVSTLLSRAERLDILINNAGRASVGACEETGADEARALFETNLFGVMRLVSASLPTMRRQGSGSIVNVGSLSGFVAAPFHGVYAASKHALAGYSEALRLEVAPFGVHVSIVEPAAHRTRIQMARPAAPLSLYDKPRSRVEAMMRTRIDGGADAGRVADAIVKVATRPGAGLRYRVGREAHLAVWGRRLLPQAAFEGMLRREFQL